MRRPGGEAGSAIVEYTLVATLLIAVFLGVVQVALVLHAHNVLVADAAEGARAAAVRDGTAAAGEHTCTALVRQALAPLVTVGGGCRASYPATGPGRPPLVQMAVHAVLPFTVLPLGRVHLDVVARAVREP